MAHVSPSFSLIEYRTRIRARLSTRGSRMALFPSRRALRTTLARSGRQRHQERVHARVVGELGVKGAQDHLALAYGDGMAVNAREDLDVIAVAGDPWRADEHRPQRVRAEALHLELDLEARDLAAERVSLGGRVDHDEVAAVAHDHARARPQDRATGLGMGPDGGLEAVALDRLRDRGALAAGNDEAVEIFELLGRPNLDRLGFQRSQHLRMGGEVTLAGEHANPQPGRRPSLGGNRACGGQPGAPRPRAAAAARPPRRAVRCRRRAWARRARSTPPPRAQGR